MSEFANKKMYLGLQFKKQSVVLLQMLVISETK